MKLSFTYDEAAAATGISKRVLEQAIANNKLVASYPTTKPVIRVAELERWLDALPTERP